MLLHRRVTMSRIAASLHQTTNFSKLAAPFNLSQYKPLTRQDLKDVVRLHYYEGKYHNLFHQVVALPSVLLLACQNIKHRDHGVLHESQRLKHKFLATHFFSLHKLSIQLSTNKFDVESCCCTIPSSETEGGDSLVLPNLQLKVVIEAIRMVLESVFDKNFVKFCYGLREDMGRHTAIRYLKNFVKNHKWWISVHFQPEKFGSVHVDKLCMLIGSKINDSAMIDIIRKLFETDVLRIDLGGSYLGRGFVQECSLSSILISIYFRGFDKEMRKLQSEIDSENPNLDGELAIWRKDSVSSSPIKMYAVRYLDEILIATSGDKMLMNELKSKVFMYLEEDMELRVDKFKTVIRSAVVDTIVFLGMELQAVKPSVIRPQKSPKAIRARKKYLRQKEVQKLELKNARETRRKMRGLKIIRDVFTKCKQGSGFEFRFQIENEVRQIFRTWGHEVVQDYFASVDDRRFHWYRKMSGGDFLSLKWIRNQLPLELVSAYDNLQEQVEKHINPIHAKRALAEKERLKEEEEQQKYSAGVVADLTKLYMKVDAPIALVRKAVQAVGFTNNMGRPRPISSLFALEDADIVKWYAGVGIRWLEYFCCCHNFKYVKIVVSYHLRFSCLLTLAEKHEATKREAMRHYTKDLKTLDLNGAEKMYFPTEREVRLMRDGRRTDPKPVDGTITMALIRLATDEPPYRCVAHFCERTDTTVYRIRLVQNAMNLEIKDPRKKSGLAMGSNHQSLNKKCLPLCSDHISELYLGRLTLQDVDCTSFVE